MEVNVQQQDIACACCGAVLDAALCNVERPSRCALCGRTVRALVFPAFFREREKGTLGEVIQTEEEATCFHHPDRRAVVVCEVCGRFLCALCHVRMKDRDMCAACVEAGVKKGGDADLDRHRVLYDRVLLSLALYPMIVPPFMIFTCITAPAVLVLAFLWRGKPGSLLSRRRSGFGVAGILACAQIAVWIIGISLLVYGDGI